MLIADVDPNTTAAGASMVACIMAAVSSLFAWLSRRDQLSTDRYVARDKLEHDKRIIEQESEIEALREQHADCEKNHAELKKEVTALRRRVDELTDRFWPAPPPIPPAA